MIAVVNIIIGWQHGLSAILPSLFECVLFLDESYRLVIIGETSVPPA